jgi:hypothetical protein
MAENGNWGGGWGLGPWGGAAPSELPQDVTESVSVTESLSVYVPLKVLSAAVLSNVFVEITYSHAVDPSFGPNVDPGNFSISPSLIVVGAVITGPNTVRLQTLQQSNVLYTITVAQGRSTPGDALDPLFDTATFTGALTAPSFFAAAQSDTKVMLTFSNEMEVDVEFTDPTNYDIRDFHGNTIVINTVVAQGPAPIRRATLELDSNLAKGGYYVAEVDPAVTTTTALSISPTTDVFQWASMEAPIFTGPIVVPIENFSGEVSDGILGDPDGLVFFSPALDVAVASSVIEIDEISVCTRAYDVYEAPQPLDPPFLYTFSPVGAAATSVLGVGTVLWAPPERVGLAHFELSEFAEDTMPTAVDGPADAILSEPIDITRASFLNDVRWQTFGGIATVFMTADNLTPIGPGPTTNISLQP